MSIGDFDGDRIDLTIQVDCDTPVAAAIDLISSEPLTLIEPAVIAAEDGTIRLDSGHAYGQGITITLSGSVDLGGEEWNLRGVVAHTGVVQRAIGEIAGLGKALPDRRRSGLLGTEFEVSGPLSQPDVKVHPLSTFTPGILRGLRSLKEPNGHDR